MVRTLYSLDGLLDRSDQFSVGESSEEKKIGDKGWQPSGLDGVRRATDPHDLARTMWRGSKQTHRRCWCR